MTATPRRKRFGQHFLIDQVIIDSIVAAIAPAPGQTLIEIGPGQGALTRPLLKRHGALTVIEIDRDLVSWWQQRPESANITLIEADVLQVDFDALAAERACRLRVVGNLPYNISTPLIFHLLASSSCIEDMLFMLQKEVVDRLAAKPGTSDYGRLSVMSQYYAEIDPLFEVPAEAFSPPPKVDSAIVRLVPHPAPPVDVQPEVLARVVKAAFAQRRKTLRNTLKGLLCGEQIEAAGIAPSARAETLGLEEFAALSRQVQPL